MLPTQYKLTGKHYVAFSGGVDSVAAAHRLNRYLDIELIFVHHATENSEKAFQETVISFSEKYDIPLHVHHITNIPDKSDSLENFWRSERYDVFHKYENPVVTCHHLDDCVETWIWSSMHGNGKIIPYNNKNVIRPFRPIRKQKFIDYAVKYGLTWTEDDSNNDTKFIRNYIRHDMMEHVLKVNPGIHKTIRKKVLDT
jgi:tRNA(Ile)-lysidine synthase